MVTGGLADPSPSRLILIGVDAASSLLVERWTRDGTLPHLAALTARGVAGRTRGVEGFFVGSTWPCFYTGANPARHGIHYLVQLVPGTYDLHRVAESAFVRREAFWTALSRAGRRVAVLDVPLTRLEPKLNGVHVVEWGGHDSLYGFRTSPPTLAGELQRRFGRHPLGDSCDATRRSADDYRSFVDALEFGVRRKSAWTRDLLGRGGWDVFLQVFTETHCVGHQCWHLHDPTHPAHDPSVARLVGDPVRRVYQAVDHAIGEVLAGAGDATVVVFAAHGISHAYGAHFLLRDLLFRLGVAAPAPLPADGGVTRRARAPLRAAATRAWGRLPAVVKTPIRSVREQLRRRASGLPTIGVDPSRSLCFAVGNGLAVGGIRLNLVGREPLGRLGVGDEASELCDRLTTDLLALTDASGRAVVRQVVRTAALYDGEHLDALPDLLVEWNESVGTGSTAFAHGAAEAVVRARSPKVGVVEGVNDYGRTGEHRSGGWFVAAGPGLGAGSVAREVSLLDLAPTFTRMLGVELPDVDGRPIPELIGKVTAT